MKISWKYPRVIGRFLPRLLCSFPSIARSAKRPSRLPLKRRYNRLRVLSLYLDKAFRIDDYVEGYEAFRRLQESGATFLLVANHLSDYDPIVTLRYIASLTSFVAKEETKGYPFIGKAIASVDGLFLPRSDLRASLGIMKTLEERLRNKETNYVIYPEGTRNKDPMKTPVNTFHPGSFKSAMRAGAYIVPMAIYGTFRVLKAAPNDRRIPLEIAFLPPLSPDDYANKSTEEIASFLQNQINEKVEQFKKMDEEYYRLKINKIPLREGRKR